MRKVLLVGGVGWLLVVGTAQAASPIEPGPQLQRFQSIAEARFPSACSPVEFVAIGESEVDPALQSAVAWATSPWLQAGLPCRITLPPAYYERQPRMRCLTIVHEYGHLAGLSHSTDPRSVMYEGTSISSSPKCRHWLRRG